MDIVIAVLAALAALYVAARKTKYMGFFWTGVGMAVTLAVGELLSIWKFGKTITDRVKEANKTAKPWQKWTIYTVPIIFAIFLIWHFGF